VIPFPRTPDASALSKIIFSSLAPSQLKSVTVTGSRSGLHAGHVAKLPDGAGTAFSPSKQFTPGERVSVVAALSSGASALRYSFTVGIATSWNGPEAATHGRRAVSSSPTQSFRSAPGLHPPIVTVSADPDTSSGDILLTPVAFHPGSTQAGPMVLDPRGRLLWFRPVRGFATNLEVQQYHHDPVLTWWQRGQTVEGEDVIVGRSYRTIATVRAGYGYIADIHEFQLTPQGTALIDAYVPVQADLTSIGGSAQGSLMDCVIQELDIKTGQVLWEWHALGHVPLTASHNGTPRSGTPYDFFHLNSIQRLPNGNLLVSSRVTWSVYEIDKQTGGVIWTLGGKDSSFKVMPGAGFEWQHDAHLTGDTLSVFDDASNTVSQEESQSSAKTIKLDMATKTASLVRQYTHSPPIVTGEEGSAQVLPNHDVFVGWGGQPEFSEFTPSGKQIFNGTLPLGISSYRAFRSSWSAQPRGRPAIAISRQSNGNATVYASWNGATRVASWRVLRGQFTGKLTPSGTVARTGFETAIVIHRGPRFVAVQALDVRGKVLGTSLAEGA
jgi:Arylsulfotransferase (ASST)